MSFQNQISILHNLFIMILEWGNTSFYMQFKKTQEHSFCYDVW